MGCNDIPCDPCVEQNPCYDDCGCLNPTTWACITKPGTQTNLDVTNDMNGLEVLNAINTTVGDLVNDIANIVVPIQNTADTHVKVTTNDTTTGFLDDKILPGSHLQRTIINPSGAEKLRLNVTPHTLISSDISNMLALGTDGNLFVGQNPADGTETKVTQGSGVTVTGDGSAGDPYVVSINPSISAIRACANGTWQAISLVAISNANVTYVSGAPQYRVRHDGSIEFKGAATFTVAFGTYYTNNRKQVATIGAISTSCITLLEQQGTADLKSINYIDAAFSTDQLVQQYGYIIRKSAQNIILEFQSSYVNPTSKTIVVNFDGAISHPNL